MTYRLISADSHFIEPPDLWHNYLEADLRERGPRVVRKNGHEEWEMEGTIFNPLGTASAGVRPGQPLRLHGTYEEDVPRTGWDPHERLREMDRVGIDGEVLYGTQAIFLHNARDPELKFACMRAFNTWAADFCSVAPARLKAVGLLPFENPDVEIEEMKRIRKLGLVSVFISVDPGEGQDYADPRYDRFWAAAQELDMPVSLHAGSDKNVSAYEDLVRRIIFEAPIRRALTMLIAGGTFERFPRLKVVSVENDVGWIPYFMQLLPGIETRHKLLAQQGRLEDARAFGADVAFSLPIVEYVRRNIWHTFLARDRCWIPLREKIGVDHLMWGSDYPHPEGGAWPEPRRVVDELLRDVSEGEKRKMAGDNATQLYGFARTMTPTG